MALNPGKRDARITIQTFTEVQSNTGQPVKTWADLTATPGMWAEVKPPTGSEQFQSRQVNAIAETTFNVRYRSDLNVEMRVVYETTPYDIQALTEIGRQEELDIRAAARIQDVV